MEIRIFREDIQLIRTKILLGFSLRQHSCLDERIHDLFFYSSPPFVFSRRESKVYSHRLDFCIQKQKSTLLDLLRILRLGLCLHKPKSNLLRIENNRKEFPLHFFSFRNYRHTFQKRFIRIRYCPIRKDIQHKSFARAWRKIRKTSVHQ